MINAKDNICPRCGAMVPNGAMVGKYPGALSRISDYEICSDCGTDEALKDYYGLAPLALSDWWFMNEGNNTALESLEPT